MRVLILHDEVGEGAASDAVDVFDQAAVIEEALSSGGARCTRMGVGLDLRGAAEAIGRSDLVVNLVESLGGRGSLIHLVPALVEAIGRPMTGCPALAIALTSNKLDAKAVLARCGIDTPAWHEFGAAKPNRGKWIIKSVWEHASIGLGPWSIVDAGERDLNEAILGAAPSLGGRAFAERFVDGREFNLSLLETESGVAVLPPAEIEFVGYAEGRPRIVDYAAKWDISSDAYRNTPRSFEFDASEGPLLDRLRSMALRCWSTFGLSGYARVDFRVDGAGRAWVLEVNTNPCLARDAGFLAAAERGGYSSEQVVGELVRAALAKKDAPCSGFAR